MSKPLRTAHAASQSFAPNPTQQRFDHADLHPPPRQSGPLVPGRFNSILMGRDSYLVEICRDVEISPVRAAMMKQPQDWLWSSDPAHAELWPGLVWLDTPLLHAHLLERDVAGAADVCRARIAYGRHVQAGRDVRPWGLAPRQQIRIGDECFVARMRAPQSKSRKGLPPRRTFSHALLAQRLPAHKPIDWRRWVSRGNPLNEVLRSVNQAGEVTIAEMALQCDLSVTPVSRLISRAENAAGKASSALSARQREMATNAL
jgi:putative transposase